MIYPAKEFLLKDGRTALLRSPSPADARACLDYMRITAGETPFLLRTPEEITMTEEQEAAYLENTAASPHTMMLLCMVDGKLAGNCQINRRTKKKNAHRGSVGIAIIREFWNLGIGTAMLRELIAIAKEWGLLQLELEVIEGNTRAMALYEKLGFRTVGFTPNAIAMENGSFAKEFLMVLPL